MKNQDEVLGVLDQLFEEVALAVGRLAAAGDLEDDAVWKLMRDLTVIRGKLRQLATNLASASDDGTNTRLPWMRPHPAVEEFLRGLGGE